MRGGKTTDKGKYMSGKLTKEAKKKEGMTDYVTK